MLILGRIANMTIPYSLLLEAPTASIVDSVLDVLEWIVMLPVAIFRGYGSLLRWAADAVQSLFEDYGYWVVFFGTLCENTLLVGLIVPGALVVLLAGLAAHDGTISWPQAIVLGIVGTIIGDTSATSWAVSAGHASARRSCCATSSRRCASPS